MKVVVVMPALNAARTLERTFHAIPLDTVDEVILVDDNSSDATHDVARSRAGVRLVLHRRGIWRSRKLLP